MSECTGARATRRLSFPLLGRGEADRVVAEVVDGVVLAEEDVACRYVLADGQRPAMTNTYQRSRGRRQGC
jgi:hypothetical protein